MNSGKVIIFIDSGFEEEFRKELERFVDEYFVVPQVFAYSRKFQPMFNNIVWPGYLVAIFTDYNDKLKDLLERWGEKLSGKAFRYYII